MIQLLSRGGSNIPYHCASANLFEALDKLRKGSMTAKELITSVEKSHLTVGIVVSEQGGAFGPYSDLWACNGPCIIWGPNIWLRTLAAEITGYRASGSAIFVRKSTVEYPPEISLIHEIGHMKQYIEDPDQFAKKVQGLNVDGNKGTAEIEADNLRRHENPICKELGLLQRVKYNDFDIPNGGSFQK
jgi:hypothetical protein